MGDEDNEPGDHHTNIPQDIILLVHYCDANEDFEAIKKSAIVDTCAIWAETASDYGVDGKKSLEEAFNVHVIPLAHPIYQVSHHRFAASVCVCSYYCIRAHDYT